VTQDDSKRKEPPIERAINGFHLAAVVVFFLIPTGLLIAALLAR
jgi:hypothetical protein